MPAWAPYGRARLLLGGWNPTDRMSSTIGTVLDARTDLVGEGCQGFFFRTPSRWRRAITTSMFRPAREAEIVLACCAKCHGCLDLMSRGDGHVMVPKGASLADRTHWRLTSSPRSGPCR